MSRGDFTIFFTHPISAVLLGLSAVLVITSLMKMTAHVKEDQEV
jgi:TctA family transporter